MMKFGLEHVRVPNKGIGSWPCVASLFLPMAALLVAGCAPTLERRVEAAAAEIQPTQRHQAGNLPLAGPVKGSAENADALARTQLEPAVARHASKPWFGARMVPVQSEEQLPSIFYERFTFNFNDAGGRVPLAVVAERIYRHTNVPVRIGADVYGSASAAAQAPVAAPVLPAPGTIVNRPGSSVLPPLPVPLASAAANDGPMPKASSEPARTLQPITDINSVEMNWQNRNMVSFLNMITDRLGLSWSYRDGVVTIQRFVTDSFELAAFAAQQDFSMTLNGSSQGNAGGSSGAGGSASSNLVITESGKVNAVQSLVATVNKMLTNVPGAYATLSEGTSRLTVTTTKESMREVRAVLRAEQEAMTRQIMLQIDIYSITNTVSNDSGVNLNVFFQNLQNTIGASLAGPPSGVGSEAGGLALNILSLANGGNPNSELVRKFGDSSFILKALHQNGVSVQHQPLTMIALNRNWARKTNLRQTGYLSETTPSTVSGAGSGAPGLKTSTITTGDRFLVQPAVLDNGTVLLKFGVSLTNLLGLFDVTAGSGATFQRVQTPEVSGTDDQATVLLRAGEVMVLTGMTRFRASTDKQSLGESIPRLLGGSSKVSDSREDFIIFVRPIIL